VTQHYYAKHRIRLQNPYLQCIIEQIPNKTESFKENRYYPMELLELVKEDEEKIPNSNEIVKNTEKPANTNNELIILEDDDEDFDQNMLEPSYYCNGW